MRKRMVSAALALCLALTLFSGTALAAGEHPFTDVPRGTGPATRCSMFMRTT